MMQEEAAIIDFLKMSPESWFSRREIARKAVRRAIYEEDRHWIDVPLASLLARGEVEQNLEGLYKLKKEGVHSL